MICVQIYRLIVTLELMGQVMKEENIKITLMIRNKKWYQLHIVTQGVSEGVTKEI